MATTLQDICSFQSGGTPSKANPAFFGGSIPWITTVALNGRNIGTEDAIDWITEEAIQKSAAKIVPVGSIMVGTRVGIGKVAVNTVPMSTSQDIISLIGIDSESWDTEFLCRFIQSKGAFLNAQARGATIKGIKIEALAGLELPEATLQQQRKIVLILNAISDVITARQRQLLALDTLIKARFVEMFGSIDNNIFDFPECTLQDVCEQIKDGTHQTPEYTEDTVNGYKFLSSKDVTTGKIDWHHLKYIPESLHKELYERITPRKGDILLAKNGTTGIAAIVDTDDVFDIYVSLALLRPIDVHPVYLWAAINSAETKRQFDSSLKGIGVPNLHLGEIKKAKILLPAKELQEQFAAFVYQIDKSKVVVQAALDKAQLLFNSLMQQYFG